MEDYQSAENHLTELTEEEQENFKHYPIYNLWKWEVFQEGGDEGGNVFYLIAIWNNDWIMHIDILELNGYKKAKSVTLCTMKCLLFSAL